MEFAIGILTIAISFLVGDMVLQITYIKNGNLLTVDSFLVGGMVLIGMAEVIHIVAVFLGYPLSKSAFLYACIIAIMVAASLLLLIIRILRGAKVPTKPEGVKYQTKEWLTILIFGILAFAQILLLAVYVPVYTEGDLTLETVQTFLFTDTVGQVNPLTGAPYEVGTPTRLKILCLPTLYAILCKLSGVAATKVVWVIVPILTLLATYAVYYALSRILFPEHRFYRGCFMVLVAILLYVGDYMLSVDGFNVLHSGFRGVVIRGTVLVPYAVGLVLRKRYRLLLFCIMAEASIVWTLYGMGACFFVTVGLLATEYILRVIQKKKGGMANAGTPE